MCRGDRPRSPVVKPPTPTPPVGWGQTGVMVGDKRATDRPYKTPNPQKRADTKVPALLFILLSYFILQNIATSRLSIRLFGCKLD
ncbi:MAG: hypothetical protein FWG68_03305 [Defluviitaleaceae bacterium]|nr:hypothetical protein [Defluviitaleaceae bacterium]